MYVEKLPSGSYRITQTKNGKRYRVTVDYKPDEDEIILLMADVIKKAPSRYNMTFDDACRPRRHNIQKCVAKSLFG